MIKFYHYLFALVSNAVNYIKLILDNSLVYRVTISDVA